ncbi:GspE/PulE family protein [Patescibacteria group bacterium]|nr:GspE/PulE family protein [Patescibacteria group bacterium]MBU4162305.1 GspE/PulE family protein [Patescibacteria group bacterium]
MKLDVKRLKAFILDADLVTKEQFKKVEQIAKANDQNIEDVLSSHDFISPDDLARLKAYILGMPFINLEQSIIPSDVLEIIPEPIARSNNIVAFRKDKKNLEVAMIDPDDLQTIEFIKKKSNLKILPRLTSPEGIKNALAQYRKTLKAEFQDLIKKDANGVKVIPFKREFGDKEKQNLKKVAEELPVIRIVDTLLRHAVLDRASDIHIEPTEKEVLVRYRIDGILHDAMTLPKQIAPGIVARIKVLSNLKLDEQRLPQDGRFKFKSNDDKYSVRVSVLPVLTGEKVVMRLLAEGAKGYSLEELGLKGEALEYIHSAIKRPTGLILVTGPTGSGKTTTLYSILEMLNTPEINICTVEDPIEYRIPRVNQTQVMPKIGLTFSSGLRSLLRQDPDIIMVGEIRDNETASLAINAALTGHLVLSTLHTNDAAGAIPRLIDMKIEPFLIASTLNVVLAQRLVRRLCASGEEYAPSQTIIKNLSKQCDCSRFLAALKEDKIIKQSQKLTDINFYHPKKSKSCPEGYKGRSGIFEVLPITESIKRLIDEGVFSEKIKDQAIKEGMRTMVEDGLVKAAQGITTIEEVLRVIME